MVNYFAFSRTLESHCKVRTERGILERPRAVLQPMSAGWCVQGADAGAKALAIPGSNPASIELWNISDQV